MVQSGLHHVTAFSGPAMRNLDFHTRVLGQRLVKKTVNFDDPGTYHLYYGDETGRPGSLMTFFPWPGARLGRQGTGQASVTALSDHMSGAGLWRACGMSRPTSSHRPRTNRALHEEDVLSHAPPPTPAASPVATKVRRPNSRRFTATSTQYQ